jgi:5-enolpyruvylshikimate-3-phosphate synthase
MRLHQTDSIGVVIVIAFLGGCLALVGAVADAGFADGVADAASRVWPYVLAALVLWAIAAAAELGAHLVVSRATLPIWLVIGRAVAAAAVALTALGAAMGLLHVAGVTDGFVGFIAVLAAWARLSARPVGRLLHPTGNR